MTRQVLRGPAPDARQPLLRTQELTKRFRVGGRGRRARYLHAVDSVSIELIERRTLGVVGESGCGKSTLGRLVAGLVSPSAGQVYFDGQPVSADLVGRVQFVFQDPAGALNPRMTIGASVAEPISGEAGKAGKAGKGERRRRALEMLSRVGLPEVIAGKLPHQLSGGQQQRVCIARALASDRRVVVLDEVISALDAIVRTQVLRLLRELQDEYGLTYLFISHDLSATAAISHQVAIMYLGEVVEVAPAAALSESGVLHPYSVCLLAARLRLQPHRQPDRSGGLLQGDVPSPVDRPSGCTFHPRCPIAQSRCVSEKPELRDNGDGHLVSCHFPGKLTEHR